MLIRFFAFVLALIAMVGPVEARRIALVVGQNAYLGGASAAIGLPHLDNPVLDAHRMAEVLPGWQGLRRRCTDGRARTGEPGAGRGCVQRPQPACRQQARSKPYTPEERQKRVAELSSTLARIGTSTDPLDQEGRRLIGQGDVAGGQAKLEKALDADEQAISEAERVAAARREKAARRARDLAVLARGTGMLTARDNVGLKPHACLSRFPSAWVIS
jgi:hypothetical protein